MTFLDDTWARVADVRDAIYVHPFVVGLGDGTLPRATFEEYMAQDALYLASYARVLAALATQAQTSDEVAFWAGASRDAIVVERELHAAHVQLDLVEASAACTAYTSYLLSLTTRGRYRVAAAGVLPCFWIYADVGKRLLATAGDLSDHPYGDWIGLYADETFDAQVEVAKGVVERLAFTASSDEIEGMHEAFATASRYEWMFWDAAWHRESWPV